MAAAIRFRVLAAPLACWIAFAPAAAQIRTVDPSSPQVSSDLAPVPLQEADYGTQAPPPDRQSLPAPGYAQQPPPVPPSSSAYRSESGGYPRGAAPATPGDANATYREEEVFGAAENVFGKGAKGLADILEKVLAKQGRPNAYIAGREGGAAIAVGLRYGEGTLYHKVEGQRPIHWTGPSIGFDAGGNAAKTFVLVYNLYDTEDIYRRFPAAEGNLYAIGGFTASYLRRGDIVIIPIRLGVGWRFGANVGYMKFTHKGTVVPF